MMIPLNKSLKATTEENENHTTNGNTPGKKNKMNKDLEKIQKRSIEILGDYPSRRAELVKKLEAAEVDLKKANELQETAQDLESYDKFADVVKRAELVRKFAKQALDQLDGAPRMNEEEYTMAVNTCKDIMNKAVSNYREKAAALMDQLKALVDEYQQTAADINSTLVKLDDAANVLQSKYPYKVQHFQDAPEKKVLEPSAWKNYAVRFYPADALKMGICCEKDPAEPHKQYDSVLAAAWQAVDNGYPRGSY